MVSIKITDNKKFMTGLLGTPMFDDYLVKEAQVTTFSSLLIDGSIHPEFYAPEEEEYMLSQVEAYCRWSKIRPFIFEYIKGKKTPLSFRIILLLNPETTETILAQADTTKAQALLDYFVLNIKYADGNVTITTGIATNSFTMDKTPEKLWDSYLLTHLEKLAIPYSVM